MATDAVHTEFAAATDAHDKAMANLQAAQGAEQTAKERLAKAHRALPPAERYAALVGQDVYVTIANNGMSFEAKLLVCSDPGIFWTLANQTAPQFYDWSLIEDIKPAR